MLLEYLNLAAGKIKEIALILILILSYLFYCYYNKGYHGTKYFHDALVCFVTCAGVDML